MGESSSSLPPEALPRQRARRVYGRRIGRPLRKERAESLGALLSRLELPRDVLTERATLNPDSFFAAPVQKLHFEIGFGNGEHLLHLMALSPQDHFIGAEPFLNGMSAFLKALPDPVPENIRVLADDALLALNSFEDQSVDILYILNPDPWPKTRHHKRRIVTEKNLRVFGRVLKDDGLMIQTTDVDELAEWMVCKTTDCLDFEWLAQSPRDWQTSPDHWLATRYENKGGKAGRTQTYLLYKRRPRAFQGEEKTQPKKQ